jgi:pilus assembly protein Flp/PilA
MQILVGFLRDECGVTAIEYALIGSLISAACIGAITTLGKTLFAGYNALATALAAAI